MKVPWKRPRSLLLTSTVQREGGQPCSTSTSSWPTARRRSPRPSRGPPSRRCSSGRCEPPAELVAGAAGRRRAELVPLHASDDLTVLNVVWAPGMRFRPHNHLMWAAIGLYGGQEDNTFYRRTGQGIVQSGGRQLRTGDVALLGDDTIHAVTNPRRDLHRRDPRLRRRHHQRPGRSEWDERDRRRGPLRLRPHPPLLRGRQQPDRPPLTA